MCPVIVSEYLQSETQYQVTPVVPSSNTEAYNLKIYLYTILGVLEKPPHESYKVLNELVHPGIIEVITNPFL